MSDEANGADETGGGKAGRPRRTGLRRLIPTWRMTLGGILVLIVVVCGALYAGYRLVDIPAPKDAATAQANVYLYSDGTQIARKGDVNRENVSLAKVPKVTQHAVLAAEDRDFYHESAVDPMAMARAGWNMLTGGGTQSGSTITQQYVKNYYLTQEQTITRKVKEFFIAVKLDNEQTKDEILTGYLNTSYFGRNAYGLQAAAHAYYDKDVSDLTPAESAYLAALVNSPSAYDVTAHPENRDRAVARWHYVVKGMVKEGWLSQSKASKMKFPDPDRAKPSAGLSGQRGYIVKAVDDYLIDHHIVDEQHLARGGYRITTTLDPDKQKAMRGAVHDQLISKLDGKSRDVDKNVRAGGASVDPKTGKIVAMYGGTDYTKHYVSMATYRAFQVGSTFKPFVFASALQNESTTQDGHPITAGTTYDGTNKREVVNDGQGTGYAPENEDHKSYGKIPVSEAMNKSVNSVFAQMGVDVGPKNVRQTAVDLGLPENTPGMDPNASIALGVATPSPLDMAEAYATLANHGQHGDFSLVDKVTHGDEVVDLPQRHTTQQVPRDAADSTTAVLRNVVDKGTGTAAQSAGRPAAGKTGTAEKDKAAWFAGYTPQLSTVIGVMGMDPRTGAQKPLYGATGLERVNGGGIPAQIWGDYTKNALQGVPVQDFDLQTNGNADIPSATPGETPGSESPSSDEPGTPGPPSTEPPTSPSTTGPPTDQPTTPPPPPTTPPNGGVDGGGWQGGNTNGGPGGDTTQGGTTEGGPGAETGGWQGGNTAQGAAYTRPDLYDD